MTAISTLMYATLKIVGTKYVPFETVKLTLGTLVLLALTIVWRPAFTAAAEYPAGKGKQVLSELVAKAKQESGLDIAMPSSSANAVPNLVRAFEKRFGLKVKHTVDTAGADEVKFAKVQTALRVGAPSPLDAVQGAGVDNWALITSGFATKIDNWQLLLAEIHSLVGSLKIEPSEISPEPFAGYSFMWADRSKALLYNTRLISEKELPRTWEDLANPKYKDKFPVAPFFDEWESGILVYPKADWLKIVDNVGKNAAAVLTYSASLDRILVGEFLFGPSNAYYLSNIKARIRKLRWDYVGSLIILHCLRSFTSSPKAPKIRLQALFLFSG